MLTCLLCINYGQVSLEIMRGHPRETPQIPAVGLATPQATPTFKHGPTLL